MPARIRLPLALYRRIRGISSAIAHRDPVSVRARSNLVAVTLKRLGNLDAIVAMGSDLHDLPLVMRQSSMPAATYDDGTFTLFLRYPDSDLRRDVFPIESVKIWAQRQATACKYASIACVSTEWARKSVIEDFGVPPHKVRAVGIGHRPRWAPQEARDWTRPRFLFVGINWKRKNGAAVVKAFARVRE